MAGEPRHAACLRIGICGIRCCRRYRSGRLMTGMRPTVISLPERYRRHWDFERRESELLYWEEFSRRPDAVVQATQQMLMFLIHRRSNDQKRMSVSYSASARPTSRKATVRLG